MFMTRWQPNVWRQMERFRDEMSHLFERAGVPAGPVLAASYPAINLWESDDKLFLEAELPGMNLEALDIFVSEGDKLTIQGERKPVEAGEKAIWHRRERGQGKFERTVTLPLPVDENKVEARFEHGVLTVTLPKSEKVKPRRIPVKGEAEQGGQPVG